MKDEKNKSKWFREAGVGIFIHWGVYSVIGRGEWVMQNEKIPLAEYDKYIPKFTAANYDPDNWARLAKNSGMRYMVLTAKHHDGFCLFDTATTSRNAVKQGPKRDLVKEYVDACRKHGLKVGLYFSLPDWSIPAFNDGPEKAPEAWGVFISLIHEQVRELCTNYGKIDVLWYDRASNLNGESPLTAETLRAQDLNIMIRELQPDCIVNERIGNKAGDFAVSEQKLDTDSGFHPWESCVTLSGGWGFNRFDHSWKTPEVVIRQMVDVASKGGNYLLNVGPTGEGEMPAPALERLAAIGRWMQANGEAIYGCAPWTVQSESLGAASNPAAKTAVVEKPEKTAATMKDALNDTTSQDTRPDLRFTAKGSTVYVFARSWRSGQLNVKSLSSARGIVRKVTLLGTATPITWLQNENGLALTVPERNEVEVPVTTFRVEF